MSQTRRACFSKSAGRVMILIIFPPVRLDSPSPLGGEGLCLAAQVIIFNIRRVIF